MVEREEFRRDGQVYLLSQLQSRRPPRVNPNWKTTYRLKTSGLVAVAVLAASREPLMRSHALTWAEIVPVTTYHAPGKVTIHQHPISISLLIRFKWSLFAWRSRRVKQTVYGVNLPYLKFLIWFRLSDFV
jgi:hypothetical protein